MKKMLGWVIALGTTLFLLTLSSYVIPEFACLLLSALFYLVLAAALATASLVGFSRWRKHSSFWIVPSLVCMAFLFCSFYFASPMAQRISDRTFEKRLGDYSNVVSNFKGGVSLCASSCEGDLQVIEAASHPEYVRAIWGTHCDDQGAVVLFRINTDVPFLHEGYLFKDYEEGSNCSKLFDSDGTSPHVPYVRHITGHWYRFSDQPGF